MEILVFTGFSSTSGVRCLIPVSALCAQSLHPHPVFSPGSLTPFVGEAFQKIDGWKIIITSLHFWINHHESCLVVSQLLLMISSFKLLLISKRYSLVSYVTILLQTWVNIYPISKKIYNTVRKCSWLIS